MYKVESFKWHVLDKRVCYKVYNEHLESIDDWMYEPYLLKIDPGSDIVSAFWDYLNELYPERVIFERKSLVDPQRKAFTGITTIKIIFLEEVDANDYSSRLNDALKARK